jgi:hypothetical protein
VIKHGHLVATRQIVVQDYRLETEARSGSSGVDPVLRPEIRRGLSVGKVPILVQLSVNFSTARLPQLQLWHFHWLVLHFMEHEEAAAIVETVEQDNVMRIYVHPLVYYIHRGLQACSNSRHVSTPRPFHQN